MSTMTRPATIRLLAAVASLLLVSALIVRTTDAAFTAETSNTGNEFRAAVVALEADSNDAMFLIDPTGTTASLAGSLVPGETVESCIVIDYTGDVDATEVDLSYDHTGATDGGLLGALSVSVERFDASSCGTAGTGSPVAASALNASFTSGTGWTATTGSQRAFLFSATLSAAADNSLQGTDATSVDFTWSTSTP